MYKKLIVTLLYGVFFYSVQAQKGGVSIAAGPLISIPVGSSAGGETSLKTGVGLIAIGQYNLSNKGALLLQTSIAGYGTKPMRSNYTGESISIFSLQGGYKYQLGSAGYFINGLTGIDSYSDYGTSITFALGAGKRFIIKDVYFIDTGIDYLFGDTDPRFNIKAVFSILQRPKPK